jgi:hypothetical protein
VRRDYENAMRSVDKDPNIMRDVIESMGSIQTSTTNVINTTKIVVNGQIYDSVDKLPPEIRAKYEQALGAMDANKNGIPDLVEGMLGPSDQTSNTAASFGMSSPRPSKPVPVNSTIEPESSGGWLLALAGILLIGVCLAAGAGVWYFYLR